MSLITFRDRNTSGDPVGPTWYLEFDAITVEEFSRTANVTTYPVETGAVLSDHYQPQPREISLQGVVSDTPSKPWVPIEELQNAAAPPSMVKRPLALDTSGQISSLQQARTGVRGVLRPIVTGPLPSERLIRGNVERARLYLPRWAQTLQVTSGSSFAASGVTRISSFLQILDGLMESRTPTNVILQTGTEYQNMMITNMVAPRVSGTGGSITFSIEMQEVIVADPAVTQKSSQQRNDSTFASKKTRGTTGTKPVRSGSKAAARARTQAIIQEVEAAEAASP